MLRKKYLKKNLIYLLISISLFSTCSIKQKNKKEGDLRKSETILFVDNHDILYYAGLKRKIRPLTRNTNNPLISSGDKPWEKYIAYNSVYKNPKNGKYQMWYQSYVGSQTPDKTLRCVVAYAESQDGIHWTKPDLDIYPFYDIKKTNIILLSNEGHSVHYGASVIVNQNDLDTTKRYKMAYWDFVVKDGGEKHGLCIAFSPDGIHWKKYSNNPVLDGGYGDREQPPYKTGEEESVITTAISDVIDVTYDSLREKYVIYSKTWIDGPKGTMFWKRAVARTESNDFIHWSKPQLVIWPNEFDAERSMTALMSSDRKKLSEKRRENVKGVQLHSGPAFYYNGIYFSLLQVLDFDVTGLMPTELAISRNGIDWKRPFQDDYFIPVDGDKQFDSGTIWSNSTPIFQKDEIWFYYGAYIDWYVDDPEYKVRRSSGIGLAVMPLDRFAYLKPIDRFGQVTLKPVELNKYKGITINADAASGVVRVEILDENGYRIKGFSKKDCNPITGDSIRHNVSWGEKSISELPNGKYLIRIFLDNAALYAITFFIK